MLARQTKVTQHRLSALNRTRLAIRYAIIAIPVALVLYLTGHVVYSYNQPNLTPTSDEVETHCYINGRKTPIEFCPPKPRGN